MIKKKCRIRGCDAPPRRPGSKLCNSHYLKQWRLKNKDKVSEYHSNNKVKRMRQCNDWKKTLHGFIKNKYAHMKSRVNSSRPKDIYWAGKDLLNKDTFYKWSINHPVLLSLYKQWVNCSYDRRLTPSVNRINPDKGYTIGNMEWVTTSQNCALASVTKNIKNKQKVSIYRALGVKL